MRKQLLLTLLLTGGMLFCGAASSWASPKPAEEETGQSATTLTGTVLDENGEPAVGASVVVKNNPKVGTSADIDGKFSIKAAPGTKLTVSYVGYQSVEVNAKADMVVTLDRNDAYLDEVVVVGYGTQKKVNLTGAVSTVDVQKQLENRPQQDLAKALQGAVPGLTITTRNGAPDATATLKIRGTGTLSNGESSDPLIIVDGVPMDDITYLNPDNIAEISVLKDAASSSIYGTRAAFGVILITTKTSTSKDRCTVKYSNNFTWSQATKLPHDASVMDQIEFALQGCYRGNEEATIFGIPLETLIPYAEAWYEQHGNKQSGYREMQPFESWDNVGDYLIDSEGSIYFYADWDRAGIFYNNAAPANTHNISIDGASGKASYHAGFGYNKTNGLMNFYDNSISRYTADMNFQVDVTDWLTAGVRINYSHREYNGLNTSDRNQFQYMWRWSSYYEPLGYMYDSDGNLVDFRNDIAYLKQDGDDLVMYDKLRMQAWIRAQIAKYVTINADFTYDLTETHDKYNRMPVWVWDGWTCNPFPTEPFLVSSTTHATQWQEEERTWTANFYATFDKSFNNAHNLKVMVGFNAEQYKYNYFYSRRYDLLDTSLPEIGLATGDDIRADSAASHRATVGFFGRINYDYKGIYLLEVNGRFDGSSRFPANDQWAFFPSMSAGYRFSEEKYWDGLRDVINNAKLRFSYGSIGNEAVGNNMFISTISSMTSYWLGSSDSQKVSMFGMPSTVSETLSWERVETLDLGLDLGFLNNKFNLTADIYQRYTKDMLAPSATLPNAIGTSAPYENAGSLRTRGYEISLNWNQRFGDWNIYASASLGDARTIVTEWYNESGLLTDYWSGRGYGDMYGFVTDRYFEMDDFEWHRDSETGGIVIDGYAPGVADQTQLEQGTFHYGPGDIKFKDLNGDGVINSGLGTKDDHGDLTVIGNSEPRYEYSFRVGATWKGFDLDLYFQGVGKRDYWSTGAFIIPQAQASVSWYGGATYNKIVYADDNSTILDYIIDQNNQYPCLYPSSFGTGTQAGVSSYGCYNYYEQSRYLQDLSYLRLKTLTFGYTIPANITRKFYVENLRIYFTGENLFFLHDGSKQYPVDPEIFQGATTSASNYNGYASWGRTYPMMRSYSFGIQLTF